MKKQPHNRRGGGEMLACGARAAEAAVESGRARRLWADARGMRGAALMQKAREAGVDIRPVSASELTAMSGLDAHQGVVVAAAPPPAVWESLLASPMSPLVALDGVTDPRNLGAVMRAARAFGAAGVVLPSRNSAALNAAAVKAAAGAAAFLPVFWRSNLRRALLDIREAGWFLAGASERAESLISEVAFAPPICWALGGEERGLRRLTAESCDVLARIPTAEGAAGCLNVSAACAACLALTAEKNRLLE